ncbi:MAG: RNA methyltransferase [Bacteroidales bacterium]|nr:RNA methyltransferase [Bacteroidales bacterium]
MTELTDQTIIDLLSPFATPQRFETMQTVLSQRTRYMTVVLEDIYQPQNASAVLRSADGFGIQDVHIIENNHEYTLNPDVEKGASSWLNMHRYSSRENNTKQALKYLKSQGYRILATTPHTDDVNLDDVEIEKGKFALIFGTEVTGISDEVRAQADEFVKIPMYGFTESFNISVSAAITMHHLRLKMEQSEVNWTLSEEEANHLMVKWLRKTVRSSDSIIKRYINEQEFN